MSSEDASARLRRFLPVNVTYARQADGYEVFMSSGVRFTIGAGQTEDGLEQARAAVRERLGETPVGAEYVDPGLDLVEWRGLWFEPYADRYGLDDPTPAQRERLEACAEAYRGGSATVDVSANVVRVVPATREQLEAARAVPVPDGFVRVVKELTGLDDAVGVIYLVLKERWEIDRPE
ncbi:hypothetical protein ABT369_02150 [Dactylosporangium sp. NPDC000244]|uniref:hypothetical protein n=1 Tax=Dactylosporangium sp. NPDC000244 TaxID=3154365 RepID=UPI00331D9360